MDKLYWKVLGPLDIVYLNEAVSGVVSVRGNLEEFFSVCHLSFLFNFRRTYWKDAEQFCLVVRVTVWDKRYRLHICLGVKLCTLNSWFSYFTEEMDKNKDNSRVVFLWILFSVSTDYNIWYSNTAPTCFVSAGRNGNGTVSTGDRWPSFACTVLQLFAPSVNCSRIPYH
jgi:hypothetical protein